MDKALADRIAANKQKYCRLLNDGNYTDVRFNPQTGALLAIHKKHNFDPTIGIFGIPRGDYERISLEVLYEYGKSVILDSECKESGVKTPEGLLDCKMFDIKGVEGNGKRNVEYKIYEASNQGVETLVLYFHEESVFSKQRIVDGYSAYMRNSKSKRVDTLYYIVNKKLHKI